MIRIIIDERKVKYRTDPKEGTEYTYEVTHEVQVPDNKTAAGVLRAIADQYDPPKRTEY